MDNKNLIPEVEKWPIYDGSDYFYKDNLKKKRRTEISAVVGVDEFTILINIEFFSCYAIAIVVGFSDFLGPARWNAFTSDN